MITTPDGVTYTFIQGHARDYAPLTRPADTNESGVEAVVERQTMWLLPTKVEDRFGNRVVYTYETRSAEPNSDRIFSNGFEARAAPQEATRYAYLGNHLVAKERKQGTTTQVFYQHTDALGTPVAQTNASGQVVTRSTYTPYGSLHTATQPEYGPGYAGRYDDPTGLVYMHHSQGGGG